MILVKSSIKCQTRRPAKHKRDHQKTKEASEKKKRSKTQAGKLCDPLGGRLMGWDICVLAHDKMNDLIQFHFMLLQIAEFCPPF